MKRINNSVLRSAFAMILGFVLVLWPEAAVTFWLLLSVSALLYRYIFSQYHALDTARQALIPIRRLYPQACIREYQEGKLGPIIDMNIDHRINDKTYDAR